jgi:large-conductance mechanosensitive channel
LVKWGLFANSVINFIILATILYIFVVQPVNKILPKKQEPPEEVWD